MNDKRGLPAICETRKRFVSLSTSDIDHETVTSIKLDTSSVKNYVSFVAASDMKWTWMIG